MRKVVVILVLALAVLLLWGASVHAQGGIRSGPLCDLYDFRWLTAVPGVRYEARELDGGCVGITFSGDFDGLQQTILAPHKVGMWGYWLFPDRMVYGRLIYVHFSYPWPETDSERLQIELIICELSRRWTCR